MAGVFAVIEIFSAACSASQVLQHASEAGYDILPANADLTAAEVQLVNKIGRERQLAIADPVAPDLCGRRRHVYRTVRRGDCRAGLD